MPATRDQANEYPGQPTERTRRLHLATLLAVTGVLLAAPANAATKLVQVGPSFTLTFRDATSGTNVTTVTVGDTVQWDWVTGFHSTTRSAAPETWDSLPQTPPSTFSHTFNVPGTYSYICTVHSTIMSGTVIVRLAPPTVSSVNPGQGPVAGGTNVTIGGMNFQSGATVRIGPNMATGVVLVDSTMLTAMTPPGAAGSADVTVTNPDGQSATLPGGWIYVPPPASFNSLTPCRLADTRNPPGPSGGPALAANSGRTFPVSGLCSIPATAKAVAIILAVVSPNDSGDLRLYPAGGAAPLASTINFRPGIVRANNAVIPLGTGGQISVQCDMPPGSTGSTHFLFDVYGYFQ